MSKDSYGFSGEFEYIGGQARPISNRLDQELYDEDKNIPGSVIKVKRVATSKAENWKIFKDGEMIFLVEGSKLGKKDKEYLRTMDGINFLIAQFKIGVKSFNGLKKSLKAETKIKRTLTKKKK